MPACPNSRSDGSPAESEAGSEIVWVTSTPPRFDDSVYFYYFKHRTSTRPPPGAARGGIQMAAGAVDFSDFALWRNGFPDELFAELRGTRPLFRHDLTPGV